MPNGFETLIWQRHPGMIGPRILAGQAVAQVLSVKISDPTK
jgi:hypothetical protein